MLQCVAHDVILLFNELAAYAHYTRFVLIVNGCAMAQALVTRALTHCQRGCTLLQHGEHGGLGLQGYCHPRHQSPPHLYFMR